MRPLTTVQAFVRASPTKPLFLHFEELLASNQYFFFFLQNEESSKKCTFDFFIYMKNPPKNEAHLSFSFYTLECYNLWYRNSFFNKIHIVEKM